MNCIKCGSEDSLVLLTSILCINHECKFYDIDYSTEILTKGYEPLDNIYEKQKIGSADAEDLLIKPSQPDKSLLGIQAPTDPKQGPLYSPNISGVTTPRGANGVAGSSGAFFGSSGIGLGTPLGSLGSSGIYLDPLIKPVNDSLILDFGIVSFPSFPWDWITDYEEDEDANWVIGCCSCTDPYCNICNNNGLTFTITTTGSSIISLPNIIAWGDTLAVNVFTDSNIPCNINCMLEIEFD